ncbi:hypothetical protein [Roseibium aggregatum]|uniref:Uncharacterized protein n=1 Tax=Roseibium aggregatum TaxID=187304 RepID=A0A0M6YB04_9HYPH|nr:hypothetical protein [Roseibium aggregatum]CTQ47276.1 hypothetical protein LAL4801_05738 [Roseibium aggregatum]
MTTITIKLAAAEWHILGDKLEGIPETILDTIHDTENYNPGGKLSRDEAWEMMQAHWPKYDAKATTKTRTIELDLDDELMVAIVRDAIDTNTWLGSMIDERNDCQESRNAWRRYLRAARSLAAKFNAAGVEVEGVPEY